MIEPVIEYNIETPRSKKIEERVENIKYFKLASHERRELRLVPINTKKQKLESSNARYKIIKSLAEIRKKEAKREKRIKR